MRESVTRIVWAAAAVVGAGIAFICAVALVDPVGTQHADSQDPFGEPPSAVGSLIGLGLGSALMAKGGWSALKRSPRKGA